MARLGSLLALALVLAPPPGSADPVTLEGVPVGQGRMILPEAVRARLAAAGAGTRPDLVLESTGVRAEIAGVLARVRVVQTFVNPFPERLEAIYVFPLPEDAAVDGYSFRIGETVVVGEVREREEARHAYAAARDQGRKAALLEEERPNLFTQSVANIPPDGKIEVHIAYVHPLLIDADRYLFRFPMVVGPRYVPGAPLSRPDLGRGWARDTDRAPDASRVTPPVLAPGTRSGNDIRISIDLAAGLPIEEIVAVSHELDVERTGEDRARIALAQGAVVPDQDFLVEYRLAGGRTAVAALAHGEGGVGAFLVVVQPKREVEAPELASREVVFVLDRSGSMEGSGIAQLRAFADRALEALNPQDEFRVVSFSEDVDELSRDALAATPENLERARGYIRSLAAGAGTELLAALREALGEGEERPERVRAVVLVTDALVADDDAVLAWIRDRPGVRFFPVAAGSAPNYYLVSRAAELGRGFATQVHDRDDARAMAEVFVERFRRPYMTDIEIDWKGLEVEDLAPSPIGDLYADRPLVLLGRYSAPGAADVVLTGRVGGREFRTTFRLELPAEAPEHDSIPALWARGRIRQIENYDLGRDTAEARSEILRLGLEYQLVTRHTSFVAVEEGEPSSTVGELRTVDVAVAPPAGMVRDPAAAPVDPEPSWTPERVEPGAGRSHRVRPDHWTLGGGGGGGAIDPWTGVLVGAIFVLAARKRRR